MQRITSLAAAAALAGQAFAAPAPLPQTTEVTSDPSVNIGLSGFSLQQVVGPTIFKNGAMQVQRTYQKFNVEVPTNVSSAAKVAAALQSGSATANPQAYDEEYLVPVTIGGQTLQLDFDTGSSDLWVFSTELPSSESSGHALYNPSVSGTADSGETWDISYGDGSGASGNVYLDTVKVGPVTATSQAVEAAESVSSEFTQDTANDGLLGLAFPTLNTCSPNACTPFFQTVESSLPKSLFTADLKHGKPGSYDFGFINTTKYTGSIAYTSVTSDTYWEFKAGGYAVGSGSTSGSIGTAIADTGTTLFYLPTSVVSAYYKKVSGAQNSNTYGGWIFPCSATLPNFVVSIGGATHTVPGSYMNYAPNGDGTCFGGIQPNTGIGFSIFGDIFLKSQFVVFDVGNNRLGFAAQSSN